MRRTKILLRQTRLGPLFALGAVAVWAAGAPAGAAPEEIQVYTNDINDPGQWGLDLHVNDVATGDGTPDHAGGEASTDRLRLTPEWSYALDTHFELGAYLPLATLDDHGAFRVDGYKVRLKWLGEHPEQGFYYGLNYEVGREDIHLDQNPWNNEIKLIGGWEGDRWLIGSNVNFDFALSGPAKTPPDVELDLKVGYKIRQGTMVGFETYNGAGTTSHFGQFNRGQQSTFLAMDTRIGRWNLNVGVGEGYGANPDGVIVKMIISAPLGGRR
jgi:hypothetical protein